MRTKGSWAIITFAVLLMIVCPATAASGQDYSIYNTQWNGCSALKIATENAGYNVRTVASTLHLLSRLSGSAVLVVIGPAKELTYEDASTVGKFVREGGSLLLADDQGLSNLLAQELGFSFHGAPLLDVGSYSKNPHYPIIGLTETHYISSGLTSILLNNATGLIQWGATPPEDLRNVVVVAQSSSTSWLDENHNETWDVGELGGFIPVVLAFQLGLGRVVLVSDPTMFTNDMIRYEDNMAFAVNIIRWLSYENVSFPVLFDVAHYTVFPEALKFFSWSFSWVTGANIIGPMVIVILFTLISLASTKIVLREEEPIHLAPKSFFEERINYMSSIWAKYYLYKAFRRRLTRKLNLPKTAQDKLVIEKVKESAPHRAHQVESVLQEHAFLSARLRDAEPPWRKKRVPWSSITVMDLFLLGLISSKELKALKDMGLTGQAGVPYPSYEFLKGNYPSYEFLEENTEILDVSRKLNYLSRELEL